MATKMQLDLDKIEAFASRGLTREQVAHNLGVSAKTLQRRAKERAEVEDAYQRGKAKGIAKIANALFDNALKGNTTAQIFYLKCNGWKESSEVEVKNITPVRIVIKDDLKS